MPTLCTNKQAAKRYHDRKATGICTKCHTQLADGSEIFCIKHRDKNRKKDNKRRKTDRVVCLDHYGWECACCGEGFAPLLQIDHIDGCGSIHRREVIKNKPTYAWLRANNFPEGFQTLCASCNSAKKNTKRCPHQLLSPEAHTQLRLQNQKFAREHYKPQYLYRHEIKSLQAS